MNCRERYEDITNHRSDTHKLSICEIKVCNTVSNSPNPPRVNGYVNTKKVLYCLNFNLYISSVTGDLIVSLGMQHYLEDLFHEYKVDLAFWGHYHSYQRTCAVYKRECQDNGLGTTHIVVGSAGFDLDFTNFWDVKWSRFYEIDYGYGRVLVANRSALYFEWVRNKDMVIRDKVWLLKPSEQVEM